MLIDIQFKTIITPKEGKITAKKLSQKYHLIPARVNLATTKKTVQIIYIDTALMRVK